MRWLWTLPDGIQHSIIAAAVMIGFGVPFWLLGIPYPGPLGALLGIVWFHGREVADADSVNRALLDNFRVVFPWYWHKDSRTDFYWPLGTNTALAFLVELGMRFFL
jgi:hypothetical protein